MAHPPGLSVLGKLEPYRRTTHHWAMELGYRFAAYEASLDQFEANVIEEKDLDSVWTDLTGHLRYILGLHNIIYQIAEYQHAYRAHQKTHTYHDMIKALSEKESPSHAAYFAIGTAIGMRHEGFSADDVKQHIRQIPLFCPNLDLNFNSHVDTMSILAERDLERSMTAIDPLAAATELLDTMFTPRIILFVSAEPSELTSVKSGLEYKNIEYALTASRFYRLEVVFACQAEDLVAKIMQCQPLYIHFSGHGCSSGPVLERTDGRASIVNHGALAGLFTLAQSYGLKGVFLNICYSGDGSQCIADAVGEVVAMKEKVSNKDAINFAKMFYIALGRGETFQMAFTWAIKAAGLEPCGEDLKPLFFTAFKEGAVTERLPLRRSISGRAGLFARSCSMGAGRTRRPTCAGLGIDRLDIADSRGEKAVLSTTSANATQVKDIEPQSQEGGIGDPIDLAKVASHDLEHSFNPPQLFTDVLFSPNGKHLVTLNPQGRVILWDSVTGARIAALPFQGHVTAIAFSSDRKNFVCALQREGIRWMKWEERLVMAGQLPEQHSIANSTLDTVTSVAMSPRREIAVMSFHNDKRTVRVMDSSGNVKRAEEFDSDEDVCNRIIFSSRGDCVAFAKSKNQLAGLLRPWERTRLVSGGIFSYKAARQIKDLTSISSTRTPILAVAASRCHRLQIGKGGKTRNFILELLRTDFTCVVVSSDGEYVMAANRDGIERTQIKGRLTQGKRLPPAIQDFLPMHGTRCMAISPDNRYLVAASSTGMVRRWDLCTNDYRSKVLMGA